MSDITDIIEKLQTSIQTVQANLPKPKKNKKGEEVPESANTVALSAVLDAMGALSEFLKCQQEGGAVSGQVDKKLRQYDDDLDDSRQQNLKGSFDITSRAYEDKVCKIKSDEDLGNESLLSHVSSLILEKLGVVLPEGDVSSCHRMFNGSVVLRVWSCKIGSSYDKMVESIKSGKNHDVNVFFNFQLTRKRQNLLYEVRQHKKSKIL